MQLSDFEHFRDILLERSQSLNQWLNSSAAGRPDDAQKVRQLLGQIKDALGRIEDSSFGHCDICHDEVELYRLEVQPIRQVCLGCISDEEKASLEEDLYLASKIHRALLPQSIPAMEGFEMEMRSLAAGSIGGDYYDFLSKTGSSTDRVIIGDAMGKGLPAGLLMSNLQGALRILSDEIDSPGRLMARLNTWLCRNVPVTKFISLVCMDLGEGENGKRNISFTNAGHCPPILAKRDGTVDRLEVTGGVLGVHDRFVYEEKNVDVDPGDLLLLYTDGMVEVEDSRGERYGEERLIEFLKKHQSVALVNIIDNLFDDISEFCGGTSINDDITAILLRQK